MGEFMTANIGGNPYLLHLCKQLGISDKAGIPTEGIDKRISDLATRTELFLSISRENSSSALPTVSVWVTPTNGFLELFHSFAKRIYVAFRSLFGSNEQENNSQILSLYRKVQDELRKPHEVSEGSDKPKTFVSVEAANYTASLTLLSRMLLQKGAAEQLISPMMSTHQAIAQSIGEFEQAVKAIRGSHVQIQTLEQESKDLEQRYLQLSQQIKELAEEDQSVLTGNPQIPSSSLPSTGPLLQRAEASFQAAKEFLSTEAKKPALEAETQVHAKAQAIEAKKTLILQASARADDISQELASVQSMELALIDSHRIFQSAIGDLPDALFTEQQKREFLQAEELIVKKAQTDIQEAQRAISACQERQNAQRKELVKQSEDAIQVFERLHQQSQKKSIPSSYATLKDMIGMQGAATKRLNEDLKSALQTFSAEIDRIREEVQKTRTGAMDLPILDLCQNLEKLGIGGSQHLQSQWESIKKEDAGSAESQAEFEALRNKAIDITAKLSIVTEMMAKLQPLSASHPNVISAQGHLVHLKKAILGSLQVVPLQYKSQRQALEQAVADCRRAVATAEEAMKESSRIAIPKKIQEQPKSKPLAPSVEEREKLLKQKIEEEEQKFQELLQRPESLCLRDLEQLQQDIPLALGIHDLSVRRAQLNHRLELPRKALLLNEKALTFLRQWAEGKKPSLENLETRDFLQKDLREAQLSSIPNAPKAIKSCIEFFNTLESFAQARQRTGQKTLRIIGRLVGFGGGSEGIWLGKEGELVTGTLSKWPTEQEASALSKKLRMVQEESMQYLLDLPQQSREKLAANLRVVEEVYSQSPQAQSIATAAREFIQALIALPKEV
jgi:hypothetical protein